MPLKKPKEPKPPKEKKAKAPKEKKPKKPKKARPPKGKKIKGGANAPAPEELEGQEEGQQQKKKKPLILLLIPPLVIAAAAAIIFFVVLPKMNGDADPEASATVEPEPPVLPSAIPIGEDVSIVGMTLEADESAAQAVKAKTVTYRYTELNNAGKAAQTYVGQLAKETPAFSVVDEEFVRQKEQPDYTAAEGMVLLARNAPAPEAEDTAAPESEPPESADPQLLALLAGADAGFDAALLEPLPVPEPEEPITYVHTVRITWSPGMCVVTADEEEGKVTSPKPATPPGGQSLSIRGAVSRLKEMEPGKLGLEGASMEEYELIPMDATEMVNGTACINVYVYNSSSATNSNQFVGSYLMSIDGQHLYRLDPVTSEIIELKDYP